MTPVIIAASVIPRVAGVAMLRGVVTVPWRGHRAVSEARSAAAVVANEIFFRIDRAPISVAAHINGAGWGMVAAASMWAGFGVDGGACESERTDGNGSD